MKQLASASAMQTWRQQLAPQDGPTIGFVPTMGALHEGHLSLAATSKKECDITVVSIFVNPTQFNNSSDFEKYPVDLARDQKLLKNLGVDVLFCPTPDDIYPDGYNNKVISQLEASRILEGAHRPGHFDGVLTVVLKLFMLVRPHKAFFGLKDHQQYELVKNMADDFFTGVEVIGHSTVREPSGLALSSRNRRLSPEGLHKASLLYKELRADQSPEQARQALQRAGFEVDYIEDFNNRRYGAVFLEGVRLIDNVEKDPI